MKIKLMGNCIRGKILPLPEKWGVLYAPPTELRNHGHTGINSEPVKIEVLDIGPSVKYVEIGDTIVLSDRNFTELGDDEIIVQEYFHGSYYWTSTGKQIDVVREKDKLNKAEDSDVKSGSILYKEEN